MARGSPSLSSNSPAGPGPISIGPSVPAPVKDSPMLTRQVQDLQLALVSIREEQARQKGQELKAKMARMKPIIIPKKNLNQGSPVLEKKDASKDDLVNTDDLTKRLNNLRNKLNKAVMESAKVADLSEVSFGAQSFTSLMEDLCQDINRVSSFSRCINGTFH